MGSRRSAGAWDHRARHLPSFYPETRRAAVGGWGHEPGPSLVLRLGWRGRSQNSGGSLDGKPSGGLSRCWSGARATVHPFSLFLAGQGPWVFRSPAQVAEDAGIPRRASTLAKWVDRCPSLSISCVGERIMTAMGGCEPHARATNACGPGSREADPAGTRDAFISGRGTELAARGAISRRRRAYSLRPGLPAGAWRLAPPSRRTPKVSRKAASSPASVALAPSARSRSPSTAAIACREEARTSSIRCRSASSSASPRLRSASISSARSAMRPSSRRMSAACAASRPSLASTSPSSRRGRASSSAKALCGTPSALLQGYSRSCRGTVFATAPEACLGGTPDPQGASSGRLQ